MSESEEYTNPDDFTNSQLFQLLGLNYDSDGEDLYGNKVTPEIIKSFTDERIIQFQKGDNKGLENFFEKVQQRLLQDYTTDWGDNNMFNQYHDPYEASDESNSDVDTDDADEEDDEDLNYDDSMEEINQVADETNYQNGVTNEDDDEYDEDDDYEDEDDSIEGFGAEQPNNIQKNKITNRYDETAVLDGDHPVMERNTLGVSNTQNVPISQGTLNPSMRNTKTQVVIINSAYRDNIFPPSTSVSSSTGFTITLSDPLYKVLEIKLSTYSIPYTWYNINESNNYFYVDTYDASSTPTYTHLLKLAIPIGNYTYSSLYTVISQTITDQASPSLDLTITQQSNVNSSVPAANTGKSKIGLSSTTEYRIRFFEETSEFSQSKYNHNLGWVLGFRGNTDTDSENYGEMIYHVGSTGVLSESILDIHGPRYFTLCLDDFCNTQMSNHIVGSTPTDNTVPMPSYWNAEHETEITDNKLSYVRDLPRKLTNAQLYTMNTVAKNDQTPLPPYDANSSSRMTNPTFTNALSMIPVDTSSMTFGSTIMKEAKPTIPRVYFGPVSIDRLRVRLQDDQGNQVDMNNRDWSFTLQVTSLYQY
jgi:hypothetical protein